MRSRSGLMAFWVDSAGSGSEPRLTPRGLGYRVVILTPNIPLCNPIIPLYISPIAPCLRSLDYSSWGLGPALSFFEVLLFHLSLRKGCRFRASGLGVKWGPE